MLNFREKAKKSYEKQKNSPFLDVKESAYLFEKVLRTSLQYPIETMRTHCTSG